MQSSQLLTARMVIVLAVVLALPVLALPPVNQRVNALLHDESAARGPGVAAVAAVAAAEKAAPAAADPREALVERPALIALPPADRDQARRSLVIQEQLKQLGANYMVLERVGGGGQFRFYCRVDMPANAIYARAFEAIEPQPLPAMERVLSEVQRWHAGQRPSGPRRPHAALVQPPLRR